MTKPLTELFEEKVTLDCGSHSCRYAARPTGQRVNGPCRCHEKILRRKPIDLATKKLIEALEFYAKGLSDLEPKPEKAHLYTEDFDMDSVEWRQRSMSDHWSGKLARQALAEFRASLEDGE